ncbi:MAG: gamma-glutamylcyclotransferase [Pseudomonadota bacterium]
MRDARDPTLRLATYGTLAPGQPNHHQVEDLGGRWLMGTVRGRLGQIGWGAALGYPGLTLAEDGEDVTVQLLESPLLPAHWVRLDAFEGPSYRRVSITVSTDEGPLAAFIYEALR